MKQLELYKSTLNFYIQFLFKNNPFNWFYSSKEFFETFWTFSGVTKTRFLMLYFGLSCTFEATGQGRIDGKIQDDSGKPIPYANVLLLSEKDSSLVKGAVSDSDGSFHFDQVTPNEYLISITSVGFHRYLNRINVPGNQVLLLPPTLLQELEEELNEVTVTAQKPLYEKQIDRMVVNVQESITAAGSSVLEVLSRSPGVLVNQQQYSIMLNGREGVMVMINNTLSRMPMESVLQMLEGMSAANVEKIELISQPPSHLDAEGAGGVIHIVTKVNTDMGTNGLFGLSAGIKRGEILGANFSFSHRGKSFSTFADYSFLQTRNVGLWKNGFRYQPQTGMTRFFRSDTDRAVFSQSHQFRAGIQKNFNENSEIGAYFNLNSTKNNMKGEGETDFQVGDSLVRTDIWYRESRNINNKGAHLHYSHQLGAKHKFRIDYDWVNLHLDNLSTYDNTLHFSQNSESIQFDLASYAPMNFHIVAMDYQFQPAAHLNIKTGVKKTWMNFRNSVRSINEGNSIIQLGSLFSLSTLMNENVSAAYVSGDWKIGDQLQVNAGLRYEHTVTDIRPIGEDWHINRNYNNIFPNLLIQRNISEKVALTLGYSRRINRPTLNNLVPVVLMINQNTQFIGNATLLPSIFDNYKLDLKYKIISISFEHSYGKDVIAPFQPNYDPKNELITMRPENLRFLQNTGLLLSAPWIISANWDLQATIQAQRRSFETSHLTVNQRHSFFDLNLNMINSFTIGKGYSAELGGNYQSKRNWGLWMFRPVGSLNLGLQKKFGEDKGTLRLAITDLLNTNNILVDTELQEPPLITYADYFLRNRTFTINYSRPFGNKKLRAVKIESTSEEDRKRMEL